MDIITTVGSNNFMTTAKQECKQHKANNSAGITTILQ